MFKGISLNSAYKQCGNSVVVPVVRRIAEKIRESNKTLSTMIMISCL